MGTVMACLRSVLISFDNSNKSLSDLSWQTMMFVFHNYELIFTDILCCVDRSILVACSALCHIISCPVKFWYTLLRLTSSALKSGSQSFLGSDFGCRMQLWLITGLRAPMRSDSCISLQCKHSQSCIVMGPLSTFFISRGHCQHVVLKKLLMTHLHKQVLLKHYHT